MSDGPIIHRLTPEDVERIDQRVQAILPATQEEIQAVIHAETQVILREKGLLETNEDKERVFKKSILVTKRKVIDVRAQGSKGKTDGANES